MQESYNARRSGGVPERPKGTGCKPVGSAYRGSNPLAPIRRSKSGTGCAGAEDDFDRLLVLSASVWQLSTRVAPRALGRSLVSRRLHERCPMEEAVLAVALEEQVGSNLTYVRTAVLAEAKLEPHSPEFGDGSREEFSGRAGAGAQTILAGLTAQERRFVAGQRRPARVEEDDGGEPVARAARLAGAETRCDHPPTNA